MTFDEYKYLVLSDLYRINQKHNLSALLQQIVIGEAFKYIFWMRTCRFFQQRKLLKYTLYPVALILLNHYRYKFGIAVPFSADIGPGFYIGHFGCIIVYPLCQIGKNCNISQGVTLGKANRGKKEGYPTIGDNVYIGPGAKIIGNICVGNDVAIGANCVVTSDIPDHAVVVGVPGKVISFEGSEGYVCNTDYDEKIRSKG